MQKKYFYGIGMLVASVCISSSGQVLKGDETEKKLAVPSVGGEKIPYYYGDLTPAEALKFEREAIERRATVARETVQEIASESVCKTAQMLLFEEAFAPELQAKNLGDPTLILQIVYATPRVQKLIELGVEGPKARDEIVACLKEALNQYLYDLPLCPAVGEPAYVGKSALACRGVGVVAMLLAELSEDPNLLPFLGRIHTREQSALDQDKTGRGVNRTAYHPSFSGATLAFAEEILLEQLVSSGPGVLNRRNFDAESASKDYEAYSIESAKHFPSVAEREVARQETLYGIAVSAAETHVGTVEHTN